MAGGHHAGGDSLTSWWIRSARELSMDDKPYPCCWAAVHPAHQMAVQGAALSHEEPIRF